jgi:hypothetical protein
MEIMTENLACLDTYPSTVAAGIEALGATAISIANRWMMGWPERVSGLLDAGGYLDHLEMQVNQEKDILANEANLCHLARREILAVYEIREAPPSPS